MHICWTRGHRPGCAGSRLTGVAALLALGLVAGCGAVGPPAGGRRPAGGATLRVGGSVSPVPTGSPKVVCIRAITAALRSVVEDRVPARRAAAGLTDSYGPDSAAVQAFTEQLPAYRDDAAARGADVAGALVWPALEASCA